MRSQLIKNLEEEKEKNQLCFINPIVLIDQQHTEFWDKYHLLSQTVDIYLWLMEIMNLDMSSIIFQVLLAFRGIENEGLHSRRSQWEFTSALVPC